MRSAKRAKRMQNESVKKKGSTNLNEEVSILRIVPVIIYFRFPYYEDKGIPSIEFCIFEFCMLY